LKRIRLQVAGVQRGIGNRIVGELDDLNVETIPGGDRLDGLENLGVRAWVTPTLMVSARAALATTAKAATATAAETVR